MILNECTKVTILSFWNIVLEILVSKPVFVEFLTSLNWMKAFWLLMLLRNYRIGHESRVFSNMLVHKNSNSREAMWWSSSFVEFLESANRRCDVVKFQFYWFTNSLKEQLQTAVFLFCSFLQVCKILPATVLSSLTSQCEIGERAIFW